MITYEIDHKELESLPLWQRATKLSDMTVERNKASSIRKKMANLLSGGFSG